jgi:putative ABC transport system permease protein
LALAAIAVGQWALLFTQGLMRGYGDGIQDAITGPMVGHVQLHAKGYEDERAMDLVLTGLAEGVRELRARPGVRDVAPRIYAPVLVAPERKAFMATVVGVDLPSESQPFGLLAAQGEPLKPRHVLIGYRLARTAGLVAGQEIAVVGQAADGSLANDLYTVQGIIKGPVDLVNRLGVVMDLADAQELFVLPDQAHELVVRMEGLAQVPAFSRDLHASCPFAGAEIRTWREIVPELTTIIDLSGKVGYFILSLVLVAAVAGTANTLMMATYERMHEFGMLLALGCSPRRVVRMILMEATMLAAVGVAAGTALGWGFVAITSRTGIDMASWGGEHVSDLAYAGMRLPLLVYPRITTLDPIVGLIAVVLVSLLAAAWPAWFAGRLDPMEAMRA